MKLVTRPYLECSTAEKNLLHDFYTIIKTHCGDTHDCKGCPFCEICYEDTSNDFLGNDVNVPEVIYAILDCLNLM